MHKLDRVGLRQWLHAQFDSCELTAVPLFARRGRVIAVDEKRVPLRHSRMETFYSDVIVDARRRGDCCGIIYCMYWIRSGEIVPLYVGKTERYGRGGKISANLTNPRFFGRWGYSRYYHLGDLGVGLRGGQKCRDWADRLFSKPSGLVLRADTFFGVTVWTHADCCPCGDCCNVASLEKCVIHHAKHFWANDNLNHRDGGEVCRCPGDVPVAVEI